MTSKRMRRTIAAVGAKYPSLGSAADVERFVRAVLQAWRRTKPRMDSESFDDARDIQIWALNLAPLTDEEVQSIIEVGPRKAWRYAKAGQGPFQKLDRVSRGFLTEQLSGQLIIKVARWRLGNLQVS